MVFDPTPIKLNQFVYRDGPYRHPQLGIEVGREFFDRHAERDQALGVLSSPGDRRPVVIVGERRMGKTSLLRHLIERLKALPAVVPVQLPIGGSLHSADDLFGEICDHLSAALELDPDALPETVEGLAPAEQLQVLARLCTAAGGKTAVLCLDEVDACLEHQETPDAERYKIAALLNALAQEDGLPIRLLCTMIRLPSGLPPAALATFFARAVLIRLAPFSPEDLSEMLAELAQAHLGLRLTPDDLAILYEQSGGWPFFAKVGLVCLGEAEPGPEQMARALAAAARHPAVNEAMEHIFRHYFDRDEKALVIALARAAGSRLEGGQVERLGPAFTAVARRLVARDFLQVDAAGRYSFRVGLLAPWFRQWGKFEEMAETYRVAIP